MRLLLQNSRTKRFYRLTQFCRRWWNRGWWVRAGVILLLLMLGIRSVPYLMPIQVGDLAQVDQAVEFRDRNYRPLGTLLSRDQEHTAVVPLEQVSPYFLQAIIAAEDQRFYHHGAVDWQAVVRASMQSLKARRIVSGASTITMQLARMVEPVPRTWGGKVHQVWYSWRIAAGMDKDAILAAYVNRLPMGGNLYGVEAASRTYFGVPAADLTLAQATVLAALPNAPTALNPYFHWDDLKQRQRYVLDRLVEDGYLTRAVCDRAFAQPVTLQSPDQSLLAAPHFLFWLAEQLPPDHAAQVQTTLDLDLQHFVEAQIKQAIEGLASQGVRQAAALVIDTATGEVLAYVGSPNYFASQEAGRNDGIQALRQPGSTLKPFLYQLALERGIIKPNSILQDVPTHYPIPGGQLYSPTDYNETFQGPVRVRATLANSLNIPAVQILEDVTVPVFLERLHDLGFTHLDQPPEHYGLGLALGSGEVSLWELTQAYWILAHNGDFTKTLTPLKSTPISDPPISPSPISPSPHWSLITDMLADPHARATAFGVDSVLNLPFPAAVKTGTSSDYRDTWTVGFTTDYLVATWVGNFDGAPMRQVSGVTGAAPLWHRIMVHLHETQEPTEFAPPTGMAKRPICAGTGQKPGPTCEAIVQEYFALEDLAAYENSAPVAVAEPQLAHRSQALQITSPRPGSRFLLYPSTHGNQDQRLEFTVQDQTLSSIEWRLNGKPMDAAGGASVFWPMQPGHWTLEARSGNHYDQIEFEVEWAEAKPTHKGFSVAED
jgi:penicillin-binding protein 1C